MFLELLLRPLGCCHHPRLQDPQLWTEQPHLQPARASQPVLLPLGRLLPLPRVAARLPVATAAQRCRPLRRHCPLLCHLARCWPLMCLAVLEVWPPGGLGVLQCRRLSGLGCR